MTANLAAARFSCLCATPMKVGGAIDEDAFRQQLRRLVGAGIGFYVGSAGTAESHSLSAEELHALYAIAVEEGHGRVPVQAVLPEQVDAHATLTHLNVAHSAGVDLAVIYPPDGRHGLKPTPAELRAYYDRVLGETDGPVGVAVSSTIGYASPAEIYPELCARYPQIGEVLLMRTPDIQLIELRDRISPQVKIGVEFETGALHALLLGANGIFSSEANILPKTSRAFLDAVQRADLEAAGRLLRDLKRFRHYVRKWGSPSARWIKMCFEAVGLPGGNLRSPLLMPTPDELTAFRLGLLALGIAEIAELTR